MKRVHTVFGLATLGALSMSAISLGQGISRIDGPKGPHPWPMKYADPARTNRTDAIGPQIGVLEWKVRTVGLVPGIAVNRAGHAILGVYYEDTLWGSDSAFAVLGPTGEWLVKRKVVPYDWGFAQGVNSWPALDHFGNVHLNSTANQIVKYSPSGTLLRTTPLGFTATNDSAIAHLADGTYIHKSLLALTKYNASGAVIWTTSAGSQSSVAVAPNGDCVLGGVKTSEPHGSVDITYFNANGSVRWQKTSTFGKNFQATFGPDNTVYHGNTTFNPDGTIKWTASIPSNHTITLGRSNRIYYYGSTNVTCLNSTNGTLIWSTTLPSGANAMRGAALDGQDSLFVSSSNGYVYKLNGLNGGLIFSVFLGAQLESPVIGTDGSLYVAGVESGTGDCFVFKVK